MAENKKENNRIVIPLANGFQLVAERNTEPDFRKEISVHIVDPDGVIHQDLVVVRPQQDENLNYDDENFDILVYADETTEDFTHHMEVGLWHEFRKIVVGTKYFSGKLDVTDPCYNKNVWCRANVNVQPGEYTCCVWLNDEDRVATIGIYKDGVIPLRADMEPVAEIGVDAGLAGFFVDKPDYNVREWADFCESLGCGENYWLRDDSFFSSSGYGDGGYDVCAVMHGDEATAVEIRFIER